MNIFQYWPQLAEGIGYTLQVTVLAFLIAITLALPVAGFRVSRLRILRFIGTSYVEILRGVPPLTWLFLVYFGAPANPEAEIELTYNWPPDDGSPAEDYGSARNFGHLAFEVDDIYATCAHLQSQGIVINRPPRDGRMAFVRSPDLISIELLQKGGRLPPQEPWLSMSNSGVW
jgi:lactoylglutathione lyase